MPPATPQPARLPMTRGFWLALAGMLAVSAAFLACAWRANADLTWSRSVLFMDEQVSLDGVDRILDAPGLGAKFRVACDGDDHRYGRSFFYLSALACAVPRALFQTPGQVVACRLFHAALLALGAWLLAVATLKSLPARLTLMVAVLGLPSSAYLATMPKPEPLQLALFALFWLVHARRNLGWGAHWILLGLAVGTKVSMAPAVGVLALIALAADGWPVGLRQLRAWAVSAAAFAAGVVVAIPALAEGRWAKVLSWLTMESHLGGATVSQVLALWRGHFATQYARWPMVPALLALLAGALAVLALWRRRPDPGHAGWRALALAAALAAPAIPMWFLVPRTSSWYMHFTLAGCLAAGLAFAEIGWEAGGARRLVAAVFVALLAGNALGHGWRANQAVFDGLAVRSEDPEHVRKMRESAWLGAMMWRLKGDPGHPVVLMLDPNAYNPAPVPGLVTRNFWGTGAGWDPQAQGIIYMPSSRAQVEAWVAGHPCAPGQAWVAGRGFDRLSAVFRRPVGGAPPKGLARRGASAIN